MFGQVFGYEVAVDSEGGHLGKREHGASVSSCVAEDVFHALRWGVVGS